MNIFTSLLTILTQLLEALQEAMVFFVTPMEIMGQSIAPIYLMFGGGLVMVLGVAIAKFFVS